MTEVSDAPRLEDGVSPPSYHFPELDLAAVQIADWRRRKMFTAPAGFRGEDNALRIAAKAMLVVGELSEAIEAVREQNFAEFEVEMADALIRLLDLAAATGCSLSTAVRDKMAVNETRPARHGKAVAL